MHRSWKGFICTQQEEVEEEEREDEEQEQEEVEVFDGYESDE